MKSSRGWSGPACVVAAALMVAIGPVATAAPLTRATVTETKNEVVYKPGTGAERPAKVADVVQGADVLRTGERSLAEIEFPDKTITRLGSKSVFTFTAGVREFHPGKGTTLIYMPKGMGGGRIVTSAITAAIEGTTVIVQEIELPPAAGQTEPRLVSKVIFLEGTGRVSLTHPQAVCPVNDRKIGPGQMITHSSDQPCLDPIQDVDLDVLLKRSAIITGFSKPLPSLSLMEAAMAAQNQERADGTLVGTTTGTGIYSPNPQAPSTQGITDPPTSNPSYVQGGLIPVGDGFFLSSRPLPGSAPLQGGGGYVIHP